MTACTAAFVWVLTRRPVEPLYRAVLIPLLGVFGVAVRALVRRPDLTRSATLYLLADGA